MLEQARKEAARVAEETREARPNGLAARRDARSSIRCSTSAKEEASAVAPRRAKKPARSSARPTSVASEVLAKGTEMSRNLRELAASLRNNAERLLRDVRLAHGGMTAQLDQVGPSERAALDGRPARPRAAAAIAARRRRSGDELDVPEFIPPH